MRRPPPLVALPQYPVVGGVGMLALLVTVAGWMKFVDVSPLEAIHFQVREGEAWRLLTTILPHVDVIHLLFNLMWLWTLGSLVEESFGHVRTAALVVLLAVGSSAAEYAFMHGGVGLSGVGYGLFGFLWVLSRRDNRFRGAVDAQTTQLFVVWFFLCIFLTAARVWHVANLAHGVGAVLGGLTGFAVAARQRARRALYAAALVCLLAGFAGAIYARPWVNLTDERGLELARLGYLDLERDHDESALKHLRAALKVREDNPSAWFNLGLALQRLGDLPAAANAYARAAELEPTERDFKEAAEQARQVVERHRAWEAGAQTQPEGVVVRRKPPHSRGKTSDDAPPATRSIDTP